ncbi:Uncharacterized kinase [Filomicrobium insigne]|uniref:Uncharacterized kinase n=1 Tax=Filomicrobium insigne TaxID=418854 RepID=A0A1H0SMG7_9HYPH|nr:hypothetical protein [Filomicrobium insigne]SDP42917.1 Uncharacterized kinase [Filomicrobium insigne]
MSQEPIVVKIGGSLARSADVLERVLAIVARSPRGVAVVPGGGVFADAVRQAQTMFGFDDLVAHQMAILGMHQTGLMFAALAPALDTSENLAEIADKVPSGEKLVWLPLNDCENDAALPATWDTTSDAIAARLAERLGRLKVIFLKSRSGGELSSVHALAEERIIDPIAARIIENAGLDFEVIAADEETRLCEILGVSMQVDVPPAPC